MKETGLLRPLLVLTSGNVTGKILGILRELLQSALWGTSFIISSYRIAQTAVLIPIHFFTATTLTTCFIPLLSTFRSEDEEKAVALEIAVFWLVLALALCLPLLFLLQAGPLVSLISPGFTPEARQTAIDFVHALALGVPFYILGSYFSCREVADMRFTLPSIRASLQSTGLMAGLALAHVYSAPSFIALGFSAAYFVFFIIAIYRARSILARLFHLHLLTAHKAVLRRMWTTMRPLLLVPLFIEGSVAVEKAVASLVSIQCVAALDYARFVTDSGLFLIATPLGLVSLSMLGTFPRERLTVWTREKMEIVLLLCVPVSFFLFSHSVDIVSICYERGAFDGESTLLTASILQFLGIGFWMQVGGFFALRILNATARNTRYMLIMFVGYGLQSLFNLAFYKLFGPITMALSVTLYGLCTFVLGSASLRMPLSTYGVLALLLAAGMGYSLGHAFLGLASQPIVLQWAACAGYWLALILALPPLRSRFLALARAVRPSSPPEEDGPN